VTALLWLGLSTFLFVVVVVVVLVVVVVAVVVVVVVVVFDICLAICLSYFWVLCALLYLWGYMSLESLFKSL